MGWKNVKEYYQVKHAVRVTQKGICIGSPYIHDIIVIGSNGTIKKRYDDGRSNEELQRYQREMDADPEKLRQLVQTPDSFTVSIPVYTYDGGDIIEKQCEELGWPNVTHDGDMMYENTFSADKTEVVAWAKRNADLGTKSAQESVEDAEKTLVERRTQLVTVEAERAKLEESYPG